MVGIDIISGKKKKSLRLPSCAHSRNNTACPREMGIKLGSPCWGLAPSAGILVKLKLANSQTECGGSSVARWGDFWTWSLCTQAAEVLSARLRSLNPSVPT